jgi:hypothetical protein
LRTALFAALPLLAGAPAEAAVGDRFWDSCPVDSVLILSSCTNPNPQTGQCGPPPPPFRNGSYGSRGSCPWYVVGVTNVPGERVTLSTSMADSVRSALRAKEGPEEQSCSLASADLRLVRKLEGTLYEVLAELRVTGEWDAKIQACRFVDTTLHTYTSVSGDSLRVLGRTLVDGDAAEVVVTANHWVP